MQRVLRHNGKEYLLIIDWSRTGTSVDPFNTYVDFRCFCQLEDTHIKTHSRLKQDTVTNHMNELLDDLEEKVLDYLNKGKIMDYKKLNYMLAVESTGEVIEFSTEDELLEEVAERVEKDKKVKLKILKVYSKVEPKKPDLTELLQKVDN